MPTTPTTPRRPSLVQTMPRPRKRQQRSISTTPRTTTVRMKLAMTRAMQRRQNRVYLAALFALSAPEFVVQK
jgi:hypothetical protein